MVKSFSVHFLIVLLFMLAKPAQALPSLLNLKGTVAPHGSMNEKYAQYNPAIGAIYWYSPFLKNICLYGSDEWKLTHLVQQWFNVNIDGSFSITNSYTHIASYFTEEMIGTLVGLIHVCTQQIQNYPQEQDAALEKLSSEIVEKIIKPFITTHTIEIKKVINSGLKQTSMRYEGQVDKIRLEKKELNRATKGKKSAALAAIKEKIRGKEKEEQDLTGKIGKIKSLIKEENIAENTIINRDFNENIHVMISQLVDALREELAGFYPRGTVVNMLLGFLWKKAGNADALRKYLNNFAAELSISQNELYQWSTPMARYGQEECDRFIAMSPAQLSKLSLEELIVALLGKEKYFSPLPQKVEMLSKTLYEGNEFPDCGETALRNFFNVLCFNKETQQFDADFFSKVGFIKMDRTFDIYTFYAKYQTRDDIETDQAHHDWACVVSNLPGVQYSMATCDITPGKDNMLMVINALCPGANTFDVFVEKVNNAGVGIEMKVDKVRHDELDIKKDAQEFKLTWVFARDHFDINFPYSGSKYWKFTEAFRLNNNLSLPQALLYALCDSDYRSLKYIPVISPNGIYCYLDDLRSDAFKRSAIRAYLRENVGNNIDFISKLMRSTDYTADFAAESSLSTIQDIITSLYNNNKDFAFVFDYFNKQTDLTLIAYIITILKRIGGEESLSIDFKPLLAWRCKQAILDHATGQFDHFLSTILRLDLDETDMPEKKEFIKSLYSLTITPNMVKTLSLKSSLGFSLFEKLIELMGSREEKLDPIFNEFIDSLMVWKISADEINDLELNNFVSIVTSLVSIKMPDKEMERKKRYFLSELYRSFGAVLGSKKLAGWSTLHLKNSEIEKIVTAKLDKDEEEKIRFVHYLIEQLMQLPANQLIYPNDPDAPSLFIKILETNVSSTDPRKPLEKLLFDTFVSANIPKKMMESQTDAIDLFVALVKVDLEKADVVKKEFVEKLLVELKASEFIKSPRPSFHCQNKKTIEALLSLNLTNLDPTIAELVTGLLRSIYKDDDLVIALLGAPLDQHDSKKIATVQLLVQLLVYEMMHSKYYIFFRDLYPLTKAILSINLNPSDPRKELEDYWMSRIISQISVDIKGRSDRVVILKNKIAAIDKETVGTEKKDFIQQLQQLLDWELEDCAQRHTEAVANIQTVFSSLKIEINIA